MKRKAFEKTLAIAAAAVMAVGTLAGCGSSETAESAAPAETQSAAAETGSVEEAATEAAEGETEAAAAEAGGGMDSWEPFAENVTLQVPVYDRGVEGIPDVVNNY